MANPSAAGNDPPGTLGGSWAHVLFEHTPNILFVKDLQGRYVDVNPAYERMIGMPRERVLGRTDAQLFPRECAEQYRGADLRVIATGEAIEFEEMTDIFGGPRTSLTYKFPIRDRHGAIIATGGILTDYTERQLVQSQLEAYVMRQRLMLATIPAILWSTDEELVVTAAEGRGLRSMNLDSERAVGQPIALLLREGSPGLAAHHRALAGETVGYEVTYGNREFACTVGPMQDSDGTVRGVAGIALDVTNERLARRALAESQARYAQLYESSPLPMWAFDADTRHFITVNEAATKLYGYSREEFLDTRVDDLRDPAHVTAMVDFVAAMVPNRVYQVEVRHRTRPGSVLEIEGHYFRTELDGRPVVVATLIDVTERNRLHQQRDRYREQLRRVSGRLVSMQEEERRQIAADLHDRVGQSLSALGIKLTVLRSMVGAPEAPAQALLDETQGILDEAGGAIRGVIAELRPEALHEFGLAAGLRNLEHHALRRYGLALSVNAPDEDRRLPAVVEAALYRICQEAIANVAKHAAATQVHVSFRSARGRAVLCVKDNGGGFRMSALQEPEKLSRWGLLMMRERADSIGALLRVSSSPGRGTYVCASWRDRRGHPRPAG